MLRSRALIFGNDNPQLGCPSHGLPVLGRSWAGAAGVLVGLILGVAEVQSASVYTPYAFTNFAGMVGVLGTADGTRSAARFNTPAGVATDSAGNVYVADGANTIRKITPSAVVTTLAGSAGLAGTNDGTGSAARFNSPTGVAADSAGNIYVADSGNHTIRKINAAGVVTTLAGKGGQFGSADDTGSAARFYNPEGVAVDQNGQVYVGDTFNNTIRKITPDGSVTTLAGTPGEYGSADGIGSTARFNSPIGLAVDQRGNVYVADSGNNTIRKITPEGFVTTLAGNPTAYGFSDGTGGAARFFSPQGIAVDTAANLYIAEESADTIRRITPAAVVTTVAGSPSMEGSADGVGSKALFYGPVGVAVDRWGNLFVADSNNIRITKGTQAFIEFRSNAGSLAITNGSFHAWLTGPPGSIAILEASTELPLWTAVQTNALPAGGLDVSVPEAAGRGFVRCRAGR